MIVTRMSVGYSGGVHGDARVLRVVDRSRRRDHELPRRREAARRSRHVTGRRTPVGYETLIVDQTGAIATITLNRPEARNALDFAMRQELLTALDKIEA